MSIHKHVWFLWYDNKINFSPLFKAASSAGLGVKETIQQNLTDCLSKSLLRSYLLLPWLASLIPNLQHQLPSAVFNHSKTECLAFPCDLLLSAWQVPRPQSDHMSLCRLSTDNCRGYKQLRWRCEWHLLSCAVHSPQNHTWRSSRCPEPLSRSSKHFAERSTAQKLTAAGLWGQSTYCTPAWALKSDCLVYILVLTLSSSVTSDVLFNFSVHTASVSLPAK